MYFLDKYFRGLLEIIYIKSYCQFFFRVDISLLILNNHCNYKACSKLKTIQYDIKISHISSLTTRRGQKKIAAVCLKFSALTNLLIDFKNCHKNTILYTKPVLLE